MGITLEETIRLPLSERIHLVHRSVNNFIMNLIAAMGVYCFFDNKPMALQEYLVEKDRQLTLF